MEVNVYFESHKNIITELLNSAKDEIKIAVAWINFNEYQEVFNLILAKGLKLDIICTDNKQNRSHQAIIDYLKSQGATIKLLKMPQSTNHMHHKFAIIDNKTILTGSFNWSPNATKSFENLMIIKDAVNATTEFLNEFDRLKRIRPKSIKTLQKKKKCKEIGCTGELFNILVFSERTTKYYETYGDLIEVCSKCENYNCIESCIPDTQFHSVLNSYKESQDLYEIEEIDRDINNYFNNYIDNEIIVHAIGRVTRELNYRDDEFISTNIIWKNKFVGNRIFDEYDTDFDVVYDNDNYMST